MRGQFNLPYKILYQNSYRKMLSVLTSDKNKKNKKLLLLSKIFNILYKILKGKLFKREII